MACCSVDIAKLGPNVRSPQRVFLWMVYGLEGGSDLDGMVWWLLHMCEILAIYGTQEVHLSYDSHSFSKSVIATACMQLPTISNRTLYRADLSVASCGQISAQGHMSASANITKFESMSQLWQKYPFPHMWLSRPPLVSPKCVSDYIIFLKA